MESNNGEVSGEAPTASKKQKKDDVSKRVTMNTVYSDDVEFMSTLSNSFIQKEKHSFDNGAKIIGEPFTCCELPDFIHPPGVVKKLKEELKEMDVEQKLSDLYQFKQSSDLSTCLIPEIVAVKNLLYGQVLEWMRKITKIPLTDKVDVSCSCYTHTDHLLCHDDELEGRRIAYIYYLVPEWNESFGGRLDLFNAINDEPSEIVTSFVPKCNQFIFFEVGPTSFHQVSEIVAFKTRTSISGWFYGPPLTPSAHRMDLIIFESPISTSVDFHQWINAIYLDPESTESIRESFEESSEIELMDFLQDEKYEALCEALDKEQIKWRETGPPNRRKYQELNLRDDLPDVIKECWDMFCSEPFLLLLSNLTGLQLHPAFEEEEREGQLGEICSSVRKWTPGSYTLLHDQSFNNCANLSVSLCFNCPEWEVEYGGYTSYVAKDEEEELLRVDPKANSLALVYITKGTSNFVKYINCRASERPKPWFQDIFCMYREKE